MADDKDLKDVLKLLRRGKARGKGGKDKVVIITMIAMIVITTITMIASIIGCTPISLQSLDFHESGLKIPLVPLRSIRI